MCVFNICLQDDSSPLNRLLINTVTGDYRLCSNGVTFTGRGKMTIQGGTYALEHYPVDRRVRAMVSSAPTKTGNASLQTPPGTIRCTIIDRNTSDNNNCTTCQ